MFGPYRFTRLIGRGGMGEVYQAEHTIKGWTVAVKLMSETVSKDPVFRERMKREARIAGRLQEPHVVPIHDYGEIDGQMFLEMRLIEGDDLDSTLQRYGPMPPTRAVAIITQVASALDAAHALGVTHRDVKPPNILITRDDFAYLVDFGIASAKTEEKLTSLGAPVGTWKYMGPERFSDGEVTPRADIYSLACVLYECLTGAAPYPSDSAGVLISAHMMNPIPRPSAAREGVPRPLDAVIARGMAKRPEDRYASAGELAQAARDALSNPDRDRVSDIVRRSQETALPERFVDPKTVRHSRPPSADPPRPSGPIRSGPPPSTTRRPAGVRRIPADAICPNEFHGQPDLGPRPTTEWTHPRRAADAAVQRTGVMAARGATRAQPLGDRRRRGRGGPGAHRGRDRHLGGHQGRRQRAGRGALDDHRPAHDPDHRVHHRTDDAGPVVRLVRFARSASPIVGRVPTGYPAGSCKPDDKTMPGAMVSVTCGQNTDSNGPRVSGYGLYSDIAALKKAFSGFIGTFTVQQCPGGKASPTTWWHTQGPEHHPRPDGVRHLQGRPAGHVEQRADADVRAGLRQPAGAKHRPGVQVVGLALVTRV
ncbi:hypothetical protein IWGMT90018_47850 [Mycobacterium kiyosense]|nr:hypothetical protein IWGMT90018_47850 [Mycobacterium kiyosense]